jgi:DNA repair protein RecO (recombination protein O)
MPLLATEGIILHLFDLGEIDQIVTCYTLARGKVRAVAKGAKKSRRRFGARIEPLSRCRLQLFEKEHRALLRLDNADLLYSHQPIREDLARLGQAFHLVEILDGLTAEGQAHGHVFMLLSRFLDDLEATETAEALTPLYEFRLLRLLGYQPRLSHCVACDRSVTEEAALFFPDQGGVLCPRCQAGPCLPNRQGGGPVKGRGPHGQYSPEGPWPLRGALRPNPFGTGGLALSSPCRALCLEAAGLPLAQMTRLRPSHGVIREVRGLISLYSRHLLGRELKTERFLAHL